jgi:hypothetical protein
MSVALMPFSRIFAVRAQHLSVSPADGVELPTLPETEQRYLTHEQLHRVSIASGRTRTLILVSATVACDSARLQRCVSRTWT